MDANSRPEEDPMNTINATRFDMPNNMANFLDAALRNRTIDAADLWSLACIHGTNWIAMRDEIMMFAFANRHCNAAAHRELCQSCELAEAIAKG
jgi:predicted aldo/keto reductase-like oxidoreductase